MNLSGLLTETKVVPASRETLQHRLDWRLKELQVRKSRGGGFGSLSDQWLMEEIETLERAIKEMDGKL